MLDFEVEDCKEEKNDDGFWQLVRPAGWLVSSVNQKLGGAVSHTTTRSKYRLEGGGHLRFSGRDWLTSRATLVLSGLSCHFVKLQEEPLVW